MVQFKRQPACPCCSGCIWLHHAWHAIEGTGPSSDDPGDPRLSLSGGATYDDSNKRIVLPNGGKLRTTTPMPHVDQAVVAFRLSVDLLHSIYTTVPDIPYAGWPTTPVIRIFFESDDSETSYEYVDLRYQPIGGSNDTTYFFGFTLELGSHRGSTDTIHHYDHLAIYRLEHSSEPWWDNPGVNYIHGPVGLRSTAVESANLWVAIARDPAGYYRAYIATSDAISSDGVHLPSINFLEDRGSGTCIELPLTAPAGTHWGIQRLGSATGETYVLDVAAGTSGGSECMPVGGIVHAPCHERAARFEILINDTIEGHVDYEFNPTGHSNSDSGAMAQVGNARVSAGGNPFGVRIYIDGDPIDTTNSYIDVEFLLSVVDEEFSESPSRGNDPAFLHVLVALDRLFTSTVYSKQPCWFHAWIDLDDHAANCDGLILEFDRTDAIVGVDADLVDPWYLYGPDAGKFASLSLAGHRTPSGGDNRVRVAVLTNSPSPGLFRIVVYTIDANGLIDDAIAIHDGVGHPGSGTYPLTGTAEFPSVSGSVFFNGVIEHDDTARTVHCDARGSGTGLYHGVDVGMLIETIRFTGMDISL